MIFAFGCNFSFVTLLSRTQYGASADGDGVSSIGVVCFPVMGATGETTGATTGGVAGVVTDGTTGSVVVITGASAGADEL